MGVQVQTATRDGQGNSLSILGRQFISFSYGGRNIEDFDLLAVFSGDRLEKGIYSSFEDITTEQDEIDGQIFWGSSFSPGELEFTLATDGISSAQLEDFKHWFQPGIEKELVLSEYHNRGIKARVASAPEISLLPFEKEIEVQIGEKKYPTRVSLYKGEIKLSFIMDDPFWYSLNGTMTETSEESLKVIFEDGIPHKDMLTFPCYLANGEFFDGEKIVSDYAGEDFEDISKNSYLYYCGTAPSYPIISLNPFMIINEDSGKISFSNEEEKGSISFGSDLQKNYSKILFSLPSIFSAYNTALILVSDYLNQAKSDVLELRAMMRDSLYNYTTRSYVIGIIDYMRENKIGVDVNGKIDGEQFKSFFIEKMKNFYSPSNSFHCEINCQNGMVLVTVKVRKSFAEETFSEIIENAGNMIKSNYISIDTRTLPVDGKIVMDNCLLVKTDIKVKSLKLDYKYKYL